MKIFEHPNQKFGKLTTAELDNGLKIMIMEKKDYSSTYAVFATKYGSIDTCFSVDNNPTISVPAGIAHFLEHKLFESEEQDAFTRFSKTGAYANAYTTFDRTCYLFNCSSNFTENLKILLDFVQNPYFTEETVQKEQGIISQEIKMYQDNPGWRVLFNMLDKMFQEHPVKIDIAGTTDSISKINAELLYQCYNTFYVPCNMCLCIAGNVNTAETLEFIDSAIKKSDIKTINRIMPKDSCGVSSQYVEQELEVVGKIFCFGYKENWDTPIRSLRDKIVTDIMLEILCGDCSYLYKKLIDSNLINDEFSYDYFNGPDYAVVFFDGESCNPKLVAKEIDFEIQRLIEEGIDTRLFEAVKKSEFGDSIRGFENLDGIVSDMVESAFYSDDIFDSINIIRDIKKDEIIRRLKGLKSQNAVLSIVKGKD